MGRQSRSALSSTSDCCLELGSTSFGKYRDRPLTAACLCVQMTERTPLQGRWKRPRLVWTPKLHQRFIEAVEQLGLKVAVPKTIMQVLSEAEAD